MAQQNILANKTFEQFLADERPRIVNLCAFLTGSRAAAEDLAQEALLAAWFNRERLVDPEGAGRWLSVIARNVCLRWLRAQGRQAQFVVEPGEGEEAAELEPPDAVTPDLEVELEQDELAELLDRAMAQLPAETRAALIQRYVLDLPQAEIAARLGLSEGAVEARLHRGKLRLHRLLLTDLREEAGAYGLIEAPGGGWQATRIWCPICGEHKLHGTLPGAGQDFELHCPHCAWSPKAFVAQSTNMPVFEGVKGFKPVMNRFSEYMHRYFRPGVETGFVKCQRCGTAAPLRLELPEHAHKYPGRGRRGMSMVCPACGSSSYTDIYGYALDLPEGRVFWRRSPRLTTLPEQELEFEGRGALLVRFQSRTSAAELDVILDRERYEVLAVNSR